MSTSNVIKFLSDYFNFYKNIFKHLRYMEMKDIQQNIQYNAKQKTSIHVYILQKRHSNLQKYIIVKLYYYEK